jgi:hypothetical protein
MSPLQSLLDDDIDRDLLEIATASNASECGEGP